MHGEIIATHVMQYGAVNNIRLNDGCQNAYFRFQLLKQKYAFFGVTCHIFCDQKNWFFWIHFLRDHYALVFTRLLHELICYFLDSNLHKSRKISGKWTSMMSKIDIDEILLGKSTRCQVFCGTFWDRYLRDHTCSDRIKLYEMYKNHKRSVQISMRSRKN